MPVSITGFKLPTSIPANSTSMHLKKSTKSVLLEMSSKNFKRSFWVFQQTKNKFLLHHYLLNIFLFFRFCLLIKTAGISANDISKSMQMFSYAMLEYKDNHQHQKLLTQTTTNIIEQGSKDKDSWLVYIFCQENEFSICVGVLYPYITVINSSSFIYLVKKARSL